MTYEIWEREHDERLVASLHSAQIVETETAPGEWFIELAHLTGWVRSTPEGEVIWYTTTGDSGGTLRGGSESARWQAYARACVRNALGELRDEVISSATKRLSAVRANAVAPR
jgi:phage gp37-like protein